jgi:hypothetical protein
VNIIWRRKKNVALKKVKLMKMKKLWNNLKHFFAGKRLQHLETNFADSSDETK